MKVSLYNTKAETIGDIDLSQKVFGRSWNPDLVHQAVVMYEANARKTIAHTKTRGEVRGGGKKPWQQKGLGRARHGSSRSPIWAGGGVTFGPRKEKIYTKDMNKKMRRVALSSALSEYVKRGNVKVVEGLRLKEPKTKEAQMILASFFGKSSCPSVLFISSGKEKNLVIASRNIPKIAVTSGSDLNAYILTKHRMVLLDKDAIHEIEKICASL